MQYRLIYLAIVFLGLFTSSCKKETPVEKPYEAEFIEADPNMTFYFRGIINGVQKNWTVTSYKDDQSLPYRFNSASGVEALGTDCKKTFCKYLMEDVEIFQNNGAGPAKNLIAAVFNISSRTGDRKEIIKQFYPGQKVFGKPRMTISDPVKDGVYIYYIDETGKEWSSFNGTGLQTGSSFKSENFFIQPFSEISCLNIWKATFSCTLYDKNGNSIQVVDGEFFTPVLVKK